MRTGSEILIWLVCGMFIGSAAFAAEPGGGPLKLSVSIRADYTDNRDSLDEPDDEETWDLYVKPRLSLYVEGERSLLDLFYAPAVRHCTDPSDSQNDEEVYHDLGVVTEFDVTPSVILRASEKLDITDDEEITEGGLTTRSDRSYLLSRSEVGVNCQVTKSTDIDVAGRFMDKQYDEDEVAVESDETQTDAMLKSMTEISPSFALLGTVGYSDFGFDSSLGLVRDFDSILVGVGSELDLNDSLSGGVTVGVQSQDYEDEAIDTETVPHLDIWLRGETTSASRLTAQFTHGLRDADVYPYASQEYSEIRATLAVDCGPRVTVSATGIYRRSDYDDALPESAPPGFGVPEGDAAEDRYIAQGSAVYNISDKTSLTLTQRYEDLESDVGESFTKNTTRLVFGREF